MPDDAKSDTGSDKQGDTGSNKDGDTGSDKGSNTGPDKDAVTKDVTKDATEDTDEPEITAPVRRNTRLVEPEPKIDIDGSKVDIDKPEPDQVDLRAAEPDTPPVPVEEKPATPEELTLTELVPDADPVEPEVAAPRREEVTLEPTPPPPVEEALPSYAAEKVEPSEGVVMNTETPPTEFKTSPSRRDTLKLHAAKDAGDVVYDLSAYDGDAHLSDEDFVRRMAAGQLTIQLEAESWRKEYNIA